MNSVGTFLARHTQSMDTICVSRVNSPRDLVRIDSRGWKDMATVEFITVYEVHDTDGGGMGVKLTKRRYKKCVREWLKGEMKATADRMHR